MLKQREETLGGDGYDSGLGGDGSILMPKLIKLYAFNFYMSIIPQ